MHSTNLIDVMKICQPHMVISLPDHIMNDTFVNGYEMNRDQMKDAVCSNNFLSSQMLLSYMRAGKHHFVLHNYSSKAFLKMKIAIQSTQKGKMI